MLLLGVCRLKVGHHRPRDQFPQLPCRGPPEALGPAARQPRPDPGSTGLEHGRFARRRQRVAGCATTRARKADRLVARIDPRVASVVPETARPRARQTAEELEQWKTHHEDRKAIDTSPAAISSILWSTVRKIGLSSAISILIADLISVLRTGELECRGLDAGREPRHFDTNV